MQPRPSGSAQPIRRRGAGDSAVARQSRSARRSPAGAHVWPGLGAPREGNLGRWEGGSAKAGPARAVLAEVAAAGAECGQERPRAQRCPSPSCRSCIAARAVGSESSGGQSEPGVGAGPGGRRRKAGGAGLETRMVKGWTWEQQVGFCRRRSSVRKRSVRKGRDREGGGGAGRGGTARFQQSLYLQPPPSPRSVAPPIQQVIREGDPRFSRG